jgi:carboxyl-terminal processing protease
MRFKLNFSKVRNFVVGALVVIASFGGGYYFGVQGFKAEVNEALYVSVNRQVPPEKNVDMSLFWQVWDTLAGKYYDKTKMIPSQMVYGAISGMVSSLGDPYTMFLPPSQNRIVNEDLSGSFEGVGIEIGYRKSNLAVIAPLAGSPAEKAGVKAGDFIIHIKDVNKGVDVDSFDMPITQAVTHIRGPKGTIVTLTLVREDVTEPIVVNITRAKLDVPSVVLSFVGDNSDIALIELNRFGGDTTTEWDKAVREITDKCQVGGLKCKGIIIDLRNNPGGYLQGAIDISSDFVPAKTTVVIQENGDGSREEFESNRLERLGTYKVVVLINGGSASASEILAGALRDVGGIKLIGEKSFGKGTIQEPLDLTGGSGLHVTTSKWLTPNGTWVHEKGLTPDIEVLPNETGEEDIQLQAAIDNL